MGAVGTLCACVLEPDVTAQNLEMAVSIFCRGSKKRKIGRTEEKIWEQTAAEMMVWTVVLYDGGVLMRRSRSQRRKLKKEELKKKKARSNLGINI